MAEKPFDDAKIFDTFINLCESIAWGKTVDEGTLFALTKNESMPEQVTRLAEAFGFMLIKLSIKEWQQIQLIHDLEIRNKELDATKKLLSEKNLHLSRTIQENYQSQKVIGQCEEMHTAIETAKAIAKYPINTLLLGPTGSGKEIIAKMIHYTSPRNDGPFIAVNCTAIPDTLFESEMFGIEKGVATGVNSRKGLVEEADGGTLFLDELADMSLPNQAKLLRVVEEKEVVRLGSSKPIPIDIKIIAATNVNLEQAIKEKKFREDLYYRLSVVEIKIPPLANRGDDILLLAHSFLKYHCLHLHRPPLVLSSAVQKKLLVYSWPGNVRELNNEMERIAALTTGDIVELSDLSPKIMRKWEEKNKDLQQDTITIFSEQEDEQSSLNLQKMEHSLILKVLKQTEGNKSKAAELLGITREGLRKKLLRFNTTT